MYKLRYIQLLLNICNINANRILHCVKSYEIRESRWFQLNPLVFRGVTKNNLLELRKISTFGKSHSFNNVLSIAYQSLVITGFVIGQFILHPAHNKCASFPKRLSLFIQLFIDKRNVKWNSSILQFSSFTSTFFAVYVCLLHNFSNKNHLLFASSF